MTDSVSVSLGFKYAFPGTYSNASAFYSFSSDVREGETEEEAKKRVEELVESWCDAKYEELETASGAKKK